MNVLLLITRCSFWRKQEKISALVAFWLLIGDPSGGVERLMQIADQML